MKPAELWAAYDNDDKKVQQALRCDGTTVWKIKRAKLVPLLRALRLVEDNPGKFPPVDWKQYEAEQQAGYARRGAKKPLSSRKHR